MTRITIDGSRDLHTYRVRCDCGDIWHGTAELITPDEANPALPIAETIVHMRLQHNAAFLDVRFTQRFALWLESYWEHANEREVWREAGRR
jgi:hypothetical protein